MCALGNLSLFFGTKNHLGETFAIAQVDKNDTAKIAA
jgi:hypothetical protein